MIPKYRLQHLDQALGHLYEFEAFLGRGAFATVLLVHNKKIGRQEALKVLGESLDGNTEFARRFVGEAKLIASLDHPNIVKVYDFGDAGGVLWYSMQHIDGPTLREELHQRHHFSHQEVVAFGGPLLDALSYSHLAGIVHRDVKPGNILIGPRGQPYLMDFGIAKIKDSSFKTRTGKILGTPAYISPEQATGGLVDGRSDLYSLALCIYQMLTGRLPFRASDPVRTLINRLQDDPIPISDLRPEIQPELEALIMKALARPAEDRFQNASEMRDALLRTLHPKAGKPTISAMAKTIPPEPLTYPVVKEPEKPESDISTLASPAKKPKPRLISPLLVALVSLVSMGVLVTALSWQAGGLGSRTTAPQRIENSLEETAQAPINEGGPSGIREESKTVAPVSESAAPGAEDDRDQEEDPARAPPATGAGNTPSSPPTPSAQLSPPPIARAVVPPTIVNQPRLDVETDLPPKCHSREVILTVLVDEEGRPASTRVLLSTEPICSAAATQLVKRYQFKPALDAADRPVAASLTLNIRFP